MNIYFCVALLCFSCVGFSIKYIVDKTVPNPFIDEVFHIPQAQTYCNQSFDQWDNKITTLPGLYLLSVGALYPLSKALEKDLCHVRNLRLVSLVSSIGNFYLIYKIMFQIRLNQNEKLYKITWASLNLAMFPVLYFFSFLYYTDALSTFTILLMFLFHCNNNNLMAGLIGGVSVLVRQNNIVFVFGIAILTMVKVLQSQVATPRSKHKASGDYFKAQLMKSVKFYMKDHSSFFQLVKKLVEELGTYFIVGCVFIAFVVINKGVVVGDKTSHEAAIHIPQLLYFSGFTIAFSPSLLFSSLPSWMNLAKKRPFLLTLSLLIVVAAVEFNSIAHPYLLADNRHYPFYLWKRFLSHSSIKYLLCPFYLMCFLLVFILPETDGTYKGVLMLCCIIYLGFTQLLEFRYFILPFLFYRFPQKLPSVYLMAVESIYYIAINSFTIYIFLTKTFSWDNLPEPQRIMW